MCSGARREPLCLLDYRGLPGRAARSGAAPGQPGCKRQDTVAQLYKPVRHYLKHHRQLLMGGGQCKNTF